MDEILRLFAEAYRTSAAHWYPPAAGPGVQQPPVASGPRAPGPNGASEDPQRPGSPEAQPASPWWIPAAPGLPPLPSLFDWIRLQASIYEEGQRIHGIVVERLIAPALVRPEVASGGGEAEQPAPDPDLLELLRQVQLLLLRHPVAAQAAFKALIAEGRRFAAREEGAAWREALGSSDLLRQLRRVWDTVSLNMLEDNPSTIVPSVYLEALLRAAKTADLDGLLQAIQKAAGGRNGAAR